MPGMQRYSITFDRWLHEKDAAGIEAQSGIVNSTLTLTLYAPMNAVQAPGLGGSITKRFVDRPLRTRRKHFKARSFCNAKTQLVLSRMCCKKG